MFNWLKPKKKAEKISSAPANPQTREEIVASAMKNAQSAREAIGAEKLEQLAALLQKKRQEQEVSPAAQAKKIIAQMDKDKVNDFLKYMVREDQTKH